MKREDGDLAKKIKAEHIRQTRRAVAVKARALSIFDELLKLPQFMAWMEQNILIRDEVDNKKKEITTYVIYTGDRKDRSLWETKMADLRQWVVNRVSQYIAVDVPVDLEDMLSEIDSRWPWLKEMMNATQNTETASEKAPD
jgi:hypothetical protein